MSSTQIHKTPFNILIQAILDRYAENGSLARTPKPGQPWRKKRILRSYTPKYYVVETMNRETALYDTKAKAKLELSRYKSVRASIEIGWILTPSWPSTYIEGCLSNTDSRPPYEKIHSEVIFNRNTGNKTQNRSRTCSACFHHYH